MLPLTPIHLPYKKLAQRAMPSQRPVVYLEHEQLKLSNKQARLAGRVALKPKIDLDDYRFEAVVDWVEFKMVLANRTQLQHLQKVIHSKIGRNAEISREDLGSGDTFRAPRLKRESMDSKAV